MDYWEEKYGKYLRCELCDKRLVALIGFPLSSGGHYEETWCPVCIHECPECGMLFEIKSERISHEMIGDFMCDNYHVYDQEPRARHLSHNAEAMAIDERYKPLDYEARKKTWFIDDAIAKALQRAHRLIGGRGLDDGQYSELKRGVRKRHKGRIDLYDQERAELWSQWADELRKAVGLPKVNDPEREQKTAAIRERLRVAAELGEIDKKIGAVSTNVSEIVELDNLLNAKEALIKQ